MMPPYYFTAYHKGPGSFGNNDCNTLEQAMNLLEDKKKNKGITPIAVIEILTNQIVWYNQELGLEYCQNIINR